MLPIEIYCKIELLDTFPANEKILQLFDMLNHETEQDVVDIYKEILTLTPLQREKMREKIRKLIYFRENFDG